MMTKRRRRRKNKTLNLVAIIRFTPTTTSHLRIRIPS
jgi:hypothetical protein